MPSLAQITVCKDHTLCYNHLNYSLLERRYKMWAEFRTWKQRKIMPHVLLVKLEAVQQHPRDFLQHVMTQYRLTRHPQVVTHGWKVELPHTKGGGSDQNRSYTQTITVPPSLQQPEAEAEIRTLRWQ